MMIANRVLDHGRNELKKVIVGQPELIKHCLLAVLCQGHALLEGVPGIAKTLVIKAIAQLFALEFKRVQCTSDLMPADIIGSNVLSLATSTFSLHRGPLFTDLLLVDEINRMPPRTQAALLEAMEERQVTIDGVRHPLSSFFTVFATQNPVEFEGTYPLPEAQLDRFLIKIEIGYPSAEEEAQLLAKYHEGFDARQLEDVDLQPVSPESLAQARAAVRAVRVEPALFGYIARLVRRTRDWPTISLGASPRAAINLMHVAKAVALMEGRDYLVPDDVKNAALPVLRHRIVLRPEAALEGVSATQTLASMLNLVEVPR